MLGPLSRCRYCRLGVVDPSPARSLARGAGPRRGVTGLVNLGNSCYMNSAVACLSHVFPLTRHLITGKFQSEVNQSNNLGSRGAIAGALAALLSELWCDCRRAGRGEGGGNPIVALVCGKIKEKMSTGA